MPRFSSKEEQEKYVQGALATLGALFGRNEPPPTASGMVSAAPAPVKPLTCFCGKPPSKLVVSEDELDELIICEDCFIALTTGYSIRARITLASEEGDRTKTGYTHPDHRGTRRYEVPSR